MKYAASVLRNTKSPISTVRYGEVVEAFLWGGVPLAPYTHRTLPTEAWGWSWGVAGR